MLGVKPNSGIKLQSVKKGYRYDQDKVRSPEETIAWVKERFRLSGYDILMQTVRIDSGRLGIPVYISRCGEDAKVIIGTRKQMGKGATPAQSEASALMELSERFSFFSYMKTRKHFRALGSEVLDDAIALRHLLMSIHDEVTPEDLVREFIKDLPLRWVPALSVWEGVDRWVPIDWFYLINEYNGPAAGNTIEEAVVQSLCEVVERHVGSVISAEKLVVPLIDPNTVSSEAGRELLRKYRAHNISLFLRDFSLDTGIPSVGVLAYDPVTFPQQSEIVFTVGTTTDPETSLCRALTEVAQLAGDFQNRTSYKPTFPKYGSLEEASYLISSVNVPIISIKDMPSLSNDDLLREIEQMVQVLRERKGWDLFVVNVTHPLLDVPTVYSIIPGAHFLDRAIGTDFPQHMARTLLRALEPAEASAQIERLMGYFGKRYDLLFFRGYAESEKSNFYEALRLYEEALSEGVPSEAEKISIVMNMAFCWKEMGSYDKALKCLKSVEGEAGNLKEFHHLRGACYYYLERYEEAIEHFERVIEIDPGSAIDYANIASSLRKLGHEREAIALYQMALELDPTLEFAKEHLASLKEKLK
ncbi:MAG: YcaO-like family protein [Syntrophobacterales bacterium]|nr:YcaO-like family protein [Syntrophobacterales bacterium]